MWPALSELYHANGAANGYDSLNQLTAFARGTLSDTNGDGVPDTVASPSTSESWNLDALGNWSSVTSNATTQTRTANQQNEVTAVGAQALAYDANGNTLTDDRGQHYVYDAWNRLVQVKSAGNTTLASYSYDALGRRIIENETGTVHDLYYSAAWQVVEERVSGQAKVQYVWSPVYVDALIERDRDADGNSTNGLEERLYVQQDANWNVTALVDTSGNVKERYIYDPYGQAIVLSAAWAEGVICSFYDGHAKWLRARTIGSSMTFTGCTLVNAYPVADMCDTHELCDAFIDAAQRLIQVVRGLDEAGIAIDDIGLRRPTLDDVFLALTGHAAELTAAGAGDTGDATPVPAGRDSGRTA